MKIKLFNREAISDGYYSNGMARYRRENNKELEVRVNEFMADKKVVDIKYQEATHGNYEDMDQNFMPFPCLCMLCQLDSVLVSLLRGYFLVLMVGLHIMLIGSSVRLAPQLLCGLHFLLDRLRLTMQTADKLLLCLSFLRHMQALFPALLVAPFL